MIQLLVKNRAAVVIVTLAIIILGWSTYQELPREANPDVKIPVVMVTTVYPGVSPADIESLVTIPLESEISSVKDIKKLSSTSAEGVSLLAIEFEPEAKISDVLQKVRDRVGRAKGKLPAEAEDPSVREISFSDVPIMIVTVAGAVDPAQLKKLSEDLSDDLGEIPGVLEAKVTGTRERMIRVQISAHRLHHYSLSLYDVVSAIGSENVNVPGGNVKTGDANVLLRIPGEFKSVADIEKVAVKRVGSRPVFVSDLGRVVDGYADRSSYSRMNGQRAVSIAVSKRAGANILQLAKKIKETTAKHQKTWPSSVRYRILGDQSRFVEDMVFELENSIITALILVVAVLLFFMGTRNSLFIALSIPLSMLLGMIAISAAGMTLNMVVLFSLILALGMLVDNAIVLVENIFRHVEEGKGLAEASIEGAKEVSGAVFASTLTTVAAFAPLVFWSGIMGQFMGFLPRTVIIVLSSSLIVAVGILPVVTSRLMKRPKEASEPTSPERPTRQRGRALRAYETLLKLSIDHRYKSAGLALLMLVATFMAYGKLNHGTQFFPEVDPDRATIAVRAPDGTDIETTDAIVRRIEAILRAEPNVDVFVSETGVAGGGNPMAGSQAAPNQARITVDFPPHRTKAKPGDKKRVENTQDTIKRIRQKVLDIPGAVFSVDKQGMGPPVGSPIAVEVSGKSFSELGRLAAMMRRELAKVAGTTDLRDDYRVGRPEMRIDIDRGAAKRVGASTQAVAGAVRNAIAGTKASALRDGADEYDIVVELDPASKSDLQAVTSLRIPGRIPTSPNTFSVPISAVAKFKLSGGSGAIRRIDQKRVVTITGDVTAGFNQNEVQKAVAARIQKEKPPTGYILRLGGANDEQKKASAFLARAFLIAVLLIGIVLVSQFNSYATPLLILGTVILSLIGVLWGLIITKTPFGIIMTGLGVISLAGVVVNNAIVLLDYVENLRSKGSELREALIQAGLVRFRPVMLTAATTILGLVPMALGINIDFRTGKFMLGGQSADWWGPMAVAVIFGLLFATLLTLVMVPTFYTIQQDTRGFAARILRRFKPLPRQTQDLHR